jgi:hypothetical protein
MKIFRKHKVSGEDIYIHNSIHYLFKDGNFIKMEVLNEEQKKMFEILHSDKATVINY